ncbi:CPBP family intramembrane metalloprotease [bacterium (Candidatus Blackallbacteria) CG17_big_fil_post_rev_8_21_14_2_50_48_46]|uniref:CPBP family intramembrane metalloprotease n=1 Tax=bacterium (Candidatus Blackallbacteria) CG17_big_fil_post_rev_8_21_14_2_50_48_46 TaxID=2014261 RepID=A0A2M7G180_9BACT|nr:MAG: CPBP family intramembrane metalloprotease [bacterium (Candidatus Blackallbacteria) CG18_big_fil_WC_8_21_14_2_50_49_26]PIW15442.1 MAG: CPBP family intramembrane metalloprotease [bacterium (Candidatus Blackallbacteria) CG17_big_fil_post_rev_8_21_14_2_50_48_46]PIW49697.1 MAG: CPBP family intramembrane metalloprotease [bacterium (Candidatus Blackallbacteria) CG13_big_fil_rev_8_21_14_2_50_49_14]
MSAPHPLSPITPETSYREDFQFLRGQVERKPFLIYIVAALLLTGQFYLASLRWLGSRIPEQIPQSLSWCGLIVLFYLILPAFLIKFVFREKLRDYGLAWNGLHKHGWPYLILLSVMVPVIVLASFNPHFKSYYPFFSYASASIGGFLLWELAYGMHFIAVEFFFRGFLLFGPAQRLGPYAILISAVPYCMVHFSKPAGEAIGAIFAGLALGYLSWKNRSIWGGALLHWGVAITMDLASSLQKLHG